MGLALIYEGAYACPVFLCDHCGEKIVKDGIYAWVPGEGDGPFLVATLHKGACDDAHTGHNDPKAKRWHWHGIRDLPLYLISNLELEEGWARAAQEKYQRDNA